MPEKKNDETPEPVEGSMTVEVGGVSWVIPDAARDDFELLDDLAQLGTATGGVALPRILRRLLGDDQTQAAFEHLRDKSTGRVPMDAADEFIGDLLAALNPN
jgi:hypothetical protein